MRLSDPADTKRFCGEMEEGLESDDGAHETAFALVPCPLKIDASVDPSSFVSLDLAILTFEAEHGEFAVTRSASQNGSEVVGRPSDGIH
jgi:hypothetical protein